MSRMLITARPADAIISTPAVRGRGQGGLRVVLIATRDPRGRQTGRKMVLNTIIGSLAALGHEVIVAHFGGSEEEAVPEAEGTPTTRYIALPGPTLFERFTGLFRWFGPQGRPLNETLYHSRRARTVIARIAAGRCDLVITDMIRTAHYGAGLGAAWIADLDDLLSRRYGRLAEEYGAEANLLGYHESIGGRLALRLGRGMVPLVLRREAGLISRREVEVAREAGVTTLVSATEAAQLSAAAAREVVAAPMAVSGPRELPPLTGRPRELVFLGGLDYGPNLRCVLKFDREIRPDLEARGRPAPPLHVIGYPAAAACRLSSAVVLEGYVEDLDRAMQSYQAMLVPPVPPGGVKTKVVVAALNGTVVVAHRTALEGLSLRPGEDVYAWSDTAELAAMLERQRAEPEEANAMARSARKWAEETHAPEVLAALWQRIVTRALERRAAAESHGSSTG